MNLRRAAPLEPLLLFQSLRRVLRTLERDEAVAPFREPARPVLPALLLLVAHDLQLGDLPELVEQLVQVVLVHLAAQIADEATDQTPDPQRHVRSVVLVRASVVIRVDWTAVGGFSPSARAGVVGTPSVQTRILCITFAFRDSGCGCGCDCVYGYGCEPRYLHHTNRSRGDEICLDVSKGERTCTSMVVIPLISHI